MQTPEANDSNPPACEDCGFPLAKEGVCPRCLLGEVAEEVGRKIEQPRIPLRLRAFDRIGEYELLSELGQGGMGVVWKARQQRLNRNVALKLIRDVRLPGEEAVQRFRREAAAIARLNHPGIIAIYEVGEDDGRFFLSMELVEGGSLHDWLRRVALSAHETATLIAKVARALHHAHSKGVLHRDLKPANILLTPSGEPKVSDFGLARILDEEKGPTLTGDMLGTANYLSPEQAYGRRELSGATDIYSIGCVLYEMLTGSAPFANLPMPSILRAVVEDDPQKPITFTSGRRVPPDLTTICLKCLEKDPRSRYSTAEALAEDLERWVRGEPILARPVARAERVWKWVRRKPILASLWLTITIILIATAIVTASLSVRLARQEQIAVNAAQAAHHRLARQLSETAQRYLRDGDVLRALPCLAEAIETGTGSVEIDEMNRIRFGIATRHAPALAKAWLGGERIHRAETNRNGTRLMIASESGAEVWHIPTRQRVGQRLQPSQKIAGAVFDSDAGRWVALELENREVVVWDPDRGTLAPAGKGRVFSTHDGGLQKTGTFVSYFDHSAEARSGVDGSLLGGPYTHPAIVSWAVPLSTDKLVLTADQSGKVHWWKAKGCDAAFPALQLVDAGVELNFGAYNPASHSAVIHSDRRCWILDCTKGTVIQTIPRLKASPQTFGWDALGQWLYISRNAMGSSLRSLIPDQHEFGARHGALGFRGSFAPMHGKIATQSWDGSARVWRLSSGLPSSPLLWQAATPASCILDPSGQWLFTRGDEPAGRLWMLREAQGARLAGNPLDTPVAMWFGAKDQLFLADTQRLAVSDAKGLEQILITAPPAERILHAGATKGGQIVFAVTGNFILAQSLADSGSTLKCTLPAHPIHTAADPSNARIAVLLEGGDLFCWDVSSGRQRRFQGPIQSVIFSSLGGKMLLTRAAGAECWDWETGAPVGRSFANDSKRPIVSLNANGTRALLWSDLSASGQHRAQVWDVDKGESLLAMTPHWQGILTATFSPDGRMVASGGMDQTLLLSDSHTGTLLTPPLRHAQQVRACGFSPDGSLCWSRSGDEILLWETRTGEIVAPTFTLPRTPRIVAFSSDSRSIAIVCDREPPLVWDLSPDTRPVTQLHLVAQVLSSHRLVEGTSALRTLTGPELRQAWKATATLISDWSPEKL